ncbi:hypothetical protein EDE11_1082 [Methylomonas methanica]|uniref:Uncharacterized protein n=1 Tax=Methylomonas methanica TaxID=421 RepID=A0ABY2CLX8_METMH|nr:hypothetical protein EDE11_1082 [Methylomonas methanica]
MVLNNSNDAPPGDGTSYGGYFIQAIPCGMSQDLQGVLPSIRTTG